MIGGVLTANELALLRTCPQRTLLYLAIPEYKTKYTARADGAPATNDNITSVQFDGGVGTLTDVEPGMTLLVGTSAGDWDVGIARIRDDSLNTGGGTGFFFIGITSEIDWADNLYLTVIDDIGLWPRHPYVGATATYMDYSIAYTNQNQAAPPVPIMGTHAVLELIGASVSATFDASDSYTAIGTPTSYDYAWYVDGVLAGNAASITLSFTAVGTYLIKLVISSNYSFCTAGSESVAYRYVIVHDCENPLNSSFALDSCRGSFSEGGWSYRVTMNAKASQSYVRDRTLCLLVAEDWYSDTKDSIGLLDGRENIVCVGWVDGESVRRSNDKSMVSFEVQGPAFWLAVQEGFPTGVDDTNAAPTDWNHIQALDPRKGLFTFLHWRTTSTAVMDCWITDDDHRLATTYTPAGSLHEQLRAIAERVNAYTVCDRYGRLFCQIDTQFIEPVSRTFPVVQTMSDKDWRDDITIERRTYSAVAQVDLSGIYYSGDLTTSSAIFSLSPGHIPRHYGDKRQIQRIALDDQAEANTLAGLWMGYLNNEFPNIDTPMSSNYRAVDIAPRMFVQMNLAVGDTPRELEWTNKKLIPREVSFNYDQRQAVMLTDVTFEAETFASDAVTGDPPIEPPDPPTTTTPAPPTICNDPKALNFGLVGDCVYPELADLVVAMNGTQIAYSLDFYTAASPAWHSIVGNLVLGATHTLTNFVVCPGGDAYCLTHHTLDNTACGAWYTSDIFATPVVWGLIVSEATLTADVGAASIFYSITVDENGVAWAVPESQTTSTTHHYYTGSGGALAHATHVIAPAAWGTDGRQFNLTQDCSNGVWSGWAGNYDAAGHVLDLATGAFFKFTFGINNTRNVNGCSPNYVVAGNSCTINAIANLDVNIYTGAAYYLGVMEDNAGIVYIDGATYNLVRNNVTIAVDSGVGGVFSSAGAQGSGFWASGTDMLWVASTAFGSNDVCSIAYSSNGGSAWASKDGDWAVALGAGWAGGAESVIKAYEI